MWGLVFLLSWAMVNWVSGCGHFSAVSGDSPGCDFKCHCAAMQFIPLAPIALYLQTVSPVLPSKQVFWKSPQICTHALTFMLENKTQGPQVVHVESSAEYLLRSVRVVACHQPFLTLGGLCLKCSPCIGVICPTQVSSCFIRVITLAPWLVFICILTPV